MWRRSLTGHLITLNKNARADFSVRALLFGVQEPLAKRITSLG